MCGIVGYFGDCDAKEVILNGLFHLEYRGYDSAGIALFNENKNLFEIYKDKGRVAHLKELITTEFPSHFGIGHTRWATHGEPNYSNSHPHYSQSRRFIIVHNGVIENAQKLKVEYLEEFSFRSDTDTEVIANLIELFSRNLDTSSAIRKALSVLEGSYALLIIDTNDKSTLYGAKNRTPLLVGCAKNGVVLASDSMALVGYADSYMHLCDKSFLIVKDNKISVFDILGFEKPYQLKPLKIDNKEISKGNYEHYMLKEINEQPGVIRRLISEYFEGDRININSKLIDTIRSSNRIYIVACGTSLYAGYCAKYFFEHLCKIDVEMLTASEALYSNVINVEKPFIIYISQSGETADVISVLKNYSSLKYPSLAITNSKESTLGHLADYVLDILAGKEIAVASTKAYIAQITMLSILAREVSGKKTNLKNNLNKVALAIEEIFSNKKIIKNVAESIYKEQDAFYIGRGLDYYASLESALKLKEITYIHTDGYPSGELKHGSIALIEKNTPVIAIITQEATNLITRSNLIETISRGAKGIVISSKYIANSSDDIVIPDVAHYLTPMVSVVVAQLLAYYVAVLRGNDVDKPKNLAKSVTVE